MVDLRFEYGEVRELGPRQRWHVDLTLFGFVVAIKGDEGQVGNGWRREAMSKVVSRRRGGDKLPLVSLLVGRQTWMVNGGQ